MKKIFISADMEGCAAVSSEHDVMPDKWEWRAARRWMTAEVVAAAEACFAAGYDEVIVADGHGNAHNIDPDALPDNVRLVRSWPRPMLQMEGADDPAVDACAFIGYHACAAAKNSILAHTYFGLAFRSIKVNGNSCSEGLLNAALAGELGKPVIFVSGDHHTVQDAQRYAPGAVGFVTKHSIGRRSQASLPPRQVCSLLKEAMGQALTRSPTKIFRLESPLVLELEMTTLLAAELLTYLPRVERADGFTVCTTFEDVRALMRFIAFAMLYTPTGAPIL